LLKYVCSLPNADPSGIGAVRQLITDDATAIAEFIRQEDKPGRGVFECLNPLRAGATTRNLENLAQIECFQIDVDFMDTTAPPERIRERIETCGLPIEELRHSGHGIQAKVVITNPVIATSEAIARAGAVHKRLVAYFGGDKMVSHPAALTRIPGTHNTKFGEWTECRIISRTPGATIELADLERFLTERTPLFERKVDGRKKANGFAVEDAAGFRLIDVTARLANMRHLGDGETSIHRTQLSCAAALLCHGKTVEETVATILNATRLLMESDARAREWDWRQEELNIRKMASDWICKNTNLVDALPEHLRGPFQECVTSGKRPKICYNTDGTAHVRGYANGHDQGGITEPTATAPSAEPKRKLRFNLVSFDDLRPGDALSYLIENLIPLKGIVVLWGKRKSLKSFFMLDAMFHVANGWEYFDRAVKQGLVIYCAFEGGHGYGKRAEALRRHYGVTSCPNFKLIKGGASLIHDHPELVEAISTQADQPPVVVVLDTLNKSLLGSESKDVDMASYIRAAEVVRDAFDCVVVIVHHPGWDESRMRGHSSLPAAADASLMAEREGDVVRITVEEMREGPQGSWVMGRAKEIVVGEDVNGKALTSLVFEHIGDDGVHSETIPARRTRGISEGQELAVIVLRRTIREKGEVLPSGLDIEGTRGIKLETWRAELLLAHALGQFRAQWQRLKNTLQTRGLIRVSDPWVWLPPMQ